MAALDNTPQPNPDIDTADISGCRYYNDDFFSKVGPIDHHASAVLISSCSIDRHARALLVSSYSIDHHARTLLVSSIAHHALHLLGSGWQLLLSWRADQMHIFVLTITLLSSDPQQDSLGTSRELASPPPPHPLFTITLPPHPHPPPTHIHARTYTHTHTRTRTLNTHLIDT
jgi:hypothetical protein